jgi:hypothetical protein
MRFCIPAFVFLAFSASASAALLSSDPSKTCDYLSDMGLSTRGWKNHYENVFGCSSPYKELGSGAPLANNLAYYVEGSPTTAKKAKLVININNKSSAVSAHQELLKAAEALSLKAAGARLPEEISSAIKSGTKASTKLGQTNIEVTRIDWPTGKGYEVKVLFD